MFKLVMEHLSHTRELDLLCTYLGLGESLGQHVFPQLETLRPQEYPGDDWSLLPCFIADGEHTFPQLTSLSLDCKLYLPFRRFLNPRIKELRITCYSSDRPNRTWPGLLDDLVSMPELESLHVSITCFVPPFTSHSRVRVVSLPRVHDVSIIGSGGEPAELLRHLAIPQDAKVDLCVLRLRETDHADPTGAAISMQLVDAIRWRLFEDGQIGVTPPIRTVCIECDNRRSIHFRAFTESQPPEYPARHHFEQGRYKSLLSITLYDDAPPSFFDIFGRAFPWTNVVWLSLSMGNFDGPLDASTASSLFGQMGSLEVLHLQGPANILAPVALSLLPQEDADLEPGHTTPMHLPRLKDLRLQELTPEGWSLPLYWFDLLLWTLQHRYYAGFCLEKLAVLGPIHGVDGEAFVADLAQYASWVEWDTDAHDPPSRISWRETRRR